MSSNPEHQQQLSVGSIQSFIEPVTPPSIGQMNSKKNHQKTHSLDLSSFNQFISGTGMPQSSIMFPSIPQPPPPPSSSTAFSSSSGSGPGSGEINSVNGNGSINADTNMSVIGNKPLLPNSSRVTSGGTLIPVKNEFDLPLDLKSRPLTLGLDDGTAPIGVGDDVLPSTGRPRSKKNMHNSSFSSSSSSPPPSSNPTALPSIVTTNTQNSLVGNRVNEQNTATAVAGGTYNTPHRAHSTSSAGNSGKTNSPTISINELNATPLEELDYMKLATDQFGCRFLQKKLESPSKAESDTVRDLMFQQIKPFFLNLILHPFGNYLIQKLCEYLTTEQKTILLNSIYPNVFKISINQYGTRSLQKIIDTIDNEYQIDLIVGGFMPNYTSISQIVLLINDLNGNHVIQKCIFKFPSSKFDFIINALVDGENIVTISTHKHGCCVLQKLLSVCTLGQVFKISVMIIKFLPNLINDQFGNYIIQFLLDIKELDFYSLVEIYNKLSTNLCQLSCLKFSSNVIEKFIKKIFNVLTCYVKGITLPNMNEDIISNVMGILLSIIDHFTKKLNVLIKDNFGNYALQTLLDVKNYSYLLDYNGNPYMSPKSVKFSREFTEKITNLICLTKDFLPSIKTTSYAKKIKLKVKSFYELTGFKLDNLKNTSVATAATGYQFPASVSVSSSLSSVAAPSLPMSVSGLGAGPGLSNGNNNNGNSNKYNKPRYYDPTDNRGGSHATAHRQHHRHFSLPANAFHKRNNSAYSSFVQLQQPYQNSGGSTYPSQDASPLNYQQQQYQFSGQQQQQQQQQSYVNSGVGNSASGLNVAPSAPSLQPMNFTSGNYVSVNSDPNSNFGTSSLYAISGSTVTRSNNIANFTATGINGSHSRTSSYGTFAEMLLTSPQSNSQPQFQQQQQQQQSQTQRIISSPYPYRNSFNNGDSDPSNLMNLPNRFYRGAGSATADTLYPSIPGLMPNNAPGSSMGSTDFSKAFGY